MPVAVALPLHTSAAPSQRAPAAPLAGDSADRPAAPAPVAVLPPLSGGSKSAGLFGLSAEERAARNDAKLAAIARDFRTDTITVPTDQQREALALASMGDSVYGEDDDTRALEAWVAELTGMEAALFCSSGTMASPLSGSLDVSALAPRQRTCASKKGPDTSRFGNGRPCRPTSSGSGRTSGNRLTAS